MSGPSCHAGCPGPIPDVRPILPVELLWFCILVVIAPDVRYFPGCPGLHVTSDVRTPFRISGHRYPENFLCWAVRRMSGPSCFAGCPGLAPGCPAPLFFVLFLVLVPCQIRCLAYTTRGTTMFLYSCCDRAGCPGFPRMSGPSFYSGCPGSIPDIGA